MPMSDATLLSLSHAQTVIEAAATIAFALSGLLEAARKRLDAVGVCVVEHAAWLWALLALCIGAMLFLRARHFALTERAMLWPDALGLGLFTASGAQIALGAGMPAIEHGPRDPHA
jgi:uncharacterized membrane protein YeiH